MNINRKENVVLSPFVYLEKGKKNYAVYDMLKNRLFGIVPEGNVEDLKKNMLESNLLIKTEGVVPFKFKKNINYYKDFIIIRELQVRITGQCDEKCNDCGNICQCFKDDKDMPEEIIQELIQQFKNIHIEKIFITGGNPFQRLDLADRIRKEIPANDYIIHYKGDLKKVLNLKEIEEKFRIVSDSNMCNTIKKENLQSDSFSYFYSQKYNICWGHKIAVDFDGEIKLCLWSDKKIGNISHDNVKNMIIDGGFDEYWELNKNAVDACKDCEFRFGCPDCRVQAIKKSGSLTAKCPSCKYNPTNGVWED